PRKDGSTGGGQLPARLRKQGGIPGAEHHARAFPEVLRSDSLPKSLAAAGDDRVQAGKFHSGLPTDRCSTPWHASNSFRKKQFGSTTTGCFIRGRRSAHAAARNSGHSVQTIAASASPRTEGKESRRTEEKSSGRSRTAGSHARTRAPAPINCRQSSTA